MVLIADYQRQDMAGNGNGSEQIQGVVILVASGFFDIPLKLFSS